VDHFPEYKPWEPAVAAKQEFPITTYQPVYFVAESLNDMKDKMKRFCEQGLTRKFHAKYNPNTATVWVDRAVTRLEAAPVEANPYAS